MSDSLLDESALSLAFGKLLADGGVGRMRFVGSSFCVVLSDRVIESLAEVSVKIH